MDTSRYLDCLAEDYSLLRDAASSVASTVPVPACPGWTMDDLVYHVAEVYLHKVTVMRTGEWPQEWPPLAIATEPRLALLARAYGELTREFAERPPDSATLTWCEYDETVGFWARRMALETVVHRIDAEVAAGLPVTHVPDDLAIDAVDEVLKRFLFYFTPEALADVRGEQLADEAAADTIVVTAGRVSWTVRPSLTDAVLVEDGASAGSGSAARATISAAPEPMLRWLWGRAADDVVQVTGDAAWADYLRRLVAATTQ